jgi:hypothetical protein
MKLPTWFATLTLHKAAAATLFVVAAAWLVIRFCWLEVSPPGFFMDEATPAIHAMCLAETGKDADGQPWPLYSRAAGGGHHPLTLTGFDILWIKVFGTSRAAFRAVSAFWIVVTALGLFFVARALAALIPPDPGDESRRSAIRVLPWMVLLAALLSPWSFQFSRIGWEAPLAPAYMILSLVGVLQSHQGGKWSTVWSVLAGLCVAASMTSYPPLRAVVPLVWATVAVLLLAVTPGWAAQWKFLKRLVAAGLVAAACLAPTIRLLVEGKINGRMNNVAIWNEAWVKEHAGSMGRRAFVFKAFLDNLAIHLHPSFLFIDGDADMRISPHISGQLSPVDMLALLLAGWMASLLVLRAVRGRPQLQETPNLVLSATTRWLTAIALIAALCAFFGLIPAALTWESIPTANRAIGAWPFVAFFTGTILTLAWSRRKWLAPVLAVVAVAHTAYYLPAYFRAYDGAPTHWFMREMADVIKKERRETPTKTIPEIVSEHFAYSYFYDEVPRYYLMGEAKMGCEKARLAVQWWRAREAGAR